MFIGARGSGQAQGDLNSTGGPEMERPYAQASSLITGAEKACVTELDLILTKQAALCPSQRFILAGYDVHG
ncbi:MAG: hypothetical protein Q7V58_15995 [Actinomycetota bacterium]|nr:hypothetical protein [Actinomycetota bacterium]